MVGNEEQFVGKSAKYLKKDVNGKKSFGTVFNLAFYLFNPLTSILTIRIILSFSLKALK